jgi:hypothetical protein
MQRHWLELNPLAAGEIDYTPHKLVEFLVERWGDPSSRNNLTD